MVVYDSSVIIDYLDGGDAAIEYVDTNHDERTVVPPLVLFEVYQGEVFKSGVADFEAVDTALDWLTVVDVTRDLARVAAELQADLRQRGDPLAARDAFIAGVARGLDDRLVVADSDFDVAGLTDRLDIEFL